MGLFILKWVAGTPGKFQEMVSIQPHHNCHLAQIRHVLWQFLGHCGCICRQIAFKICPYVDMTLTHYIKGYAVKKDTLWFAHPDTLW